MDTMIGRELGGCYISELIGQGGMGAVYRAHHSGLDIPVAVKVLRPVLPVTNEVERFMREARTAAKLRHPNIIGVLNVGCEDGIHFIVMEYIEGGNLLDIIKKKKRFSVTETGRIGSEVLSALEIAFENGIVHRDIKPENILIDKNGNVKLADLGLALIDGETKLTQTSMMLGSPFYIAPEQAENSGTVDHRADIYSLGCTLFHMVSGSPPFRGDSPVEIILAHLKRPVPELHKVDRTIPVAFSDVVHIMMEKKPSKRFRSPREAKQYLQEAMSVAPRKARITVPRIPSLSGQPLPSLLVAGLALAIVALVVTLFFVLYKANNQAPDIYISSSTTDTAVEPQGLKNKPESNTQADSTEKHYSTYMKEFDTRNITIARSVLQTVLQRDVTELKRLLNSGKSPNPMPDDPLSPLHAAVSTGDTASLATLLSMGADPNIRDSSGDTPLHDAIRSEDLAAVKALLQMGANPNLKDQYGKRPIQIAGKNKVLIAALRGYGGR